MPISNIPLFSMLRTRMQWHQERQKVLAENVANADTPNFRPRDLGPLQFDRATPTLTAVGLDRTAAGHFASSEASSSQFQSSGSAGFQVRTVGGQVNLEDEMIKVAANQMDYQAATTLYTRSLGLIKTAIGKR